jgi:hypothetical protein
VVERGAGVAERILWLAAGGGGERLDGADERLVLGIFAGPQVLQRDENGLGGGGIAAHRRQPAAVAGKELVVRQPVGIRP